MLNYVKEHYAYITTPSKYQGVDLLRALAVIMVILYHFGLYNITYYLQKIGWVGVDLFFVLSGFLIGGLLINEYEKNTRINFVEFYKRRLFRIYPVYMFATIASIIGHLFIVKSTKFNFVTFINQLFVDAFFLQSYIRYDNSLIGEGTWSLVIEEFFYLFAPLFIILVMWLSKKNLKVLLISLSLVFASGIFSRLFLNRNVAPTDDNWHFAHSILPQARYDELAMGIIIAVIVKLGILQKFWSKLYIIGGILLVMLYAYLYKHPVIFDKPFMMTHQTYYIYTILSFSFGCILLSVFRLKVGSKLVNLIAKISYCAYLVQFLPGLFIPKTFFNLDQGLRFLFILFLAYLVSLLIEYPFLRLYKSKPIIKEKLESNTIVVTT
ncbi:acyltransferase [Paenibacillus qinlingensis]|uniref:Peptidoglycan/LPS O-acetylase OafA/YrhL n=1 Tax=Paenibacillus qinlingensis TaxID=1837343 RepID=A0ABU1NXG4_9BACL|nr:acyltransferase [Paenibacillus qinlingensis]MDR6552193.1 peptidoglycan/LPS O-acetylase OafA/YrhL [Paenibacillus qinlingensis]